MKFTIDVEDFWLDDDTGIEKGLRDYIKRDVVSQIKASLQA